MELLYLWINNFRGIIINQGFKLSSRFNIDFNPSDGSIRIEENNNYIENFFDKNIVDIVAFVGENGSGKSTLLKYFVHECFTPVSKSPDRSSDMIIYKVGNTINIYFIDKLNLKEENIEYNKEKYKLKIQESTTNIYWKDAGDIYGVDKTKVDNFDQTAFIYFSDVVDLNETSTSFNGLNNICTNYLLASDKEKLINDPLLPFSELTAFKIKELDRQIEYVISKNHENFKLFKLPKLIGIKVSNGDKLSINNLLQKLQGIHRKKATRNEKLQRIFFEKINRLVAKHQSLLIGSDFLSIMKYKFRISFIYNHIRAVLQIFSSFDFSEKTFIELGRCYLDSFDSNGFNIELFSIKIIKGEKGISSEFNFNLLSDKIYNYISFEDMVFNDIADYDPNDDKLWFENIYLDVSHKILPKARDVYNKSYTLTNFLQWFWHDMSSGERAYLTMFSRLNSLNNSINDDFTLKKNLIIFLDEAELYFHPQWQKKIISFIINEFPVIFKNNKIQIFITSHSPFILSDLPPSNVLLIRKGNKKDIDYKGEILENKCVVEKRIKVKSFGSNIHELLSVDFFLTNGLFGEFAKEKIERIILELNEHRIKPIEEKRLSDIKNTIIMVGEPLIKQKLIELYEEKIKEGFYERLEDKISKLKNQLKKAEKALELKKKTK